MNKEIITIYNKSLTRIGFIEDYKSFQFSEKYSDAGSFTIKLAYNKKYDDLISIMYFIKYKDFDGIITSIQKTTDTDGITELVLSGSTLNWLLSMRVDTNIPYWNKTVAEILQEMINDNFINTDTEERKMPYFQIGTIANLSTTISVYSSPFDNVLNIIKTFAEKYNFGFKIVLDEANKKLIFNVYKNTTTAKIGTDTDNILQRDYTNSISNYKNVAYVDAINEDSKSHILTGINLKASSGLNRFETIASSSVTKTSDEAVATFNTRVNNTAAALISKEVKVYDAELDTNLTDDLELGEKITIKDTEYNINTTLQVNEKQTTVENGIEAKTYIFGDDVKITTVRR